jgi:hypothetical protein
MLWLDLSAPYRILFRDLMENADVVRETILEWIFRKYDCGGGSRERGGAAVNGEMGLGFCKL